MKRYLLLIICFFILLFIPLMGKGHNPSEDLLLKNIIEDMKNQIHSNELAISNLNIQFRVLGKTLEEENRSYRLEISNLKIRIVDLERKIRLLEIQIKRIQ